MAVVSGSRATRNTQRAGLYAVLVAFAVVMLFPFVYLVATALKETDDVFAYPPRLLPRSQQTAVVDGETVPLYRVDGRQLALTGSVDIGVYAPPDDPTATVQAPERDVDPTGGYTNPETVVVGGEEVDLYDVPVDGAADGAVRSLIQVDTVEQGRFTDPAGGSEEVVAPLAGAEPVESVSARPGNFSDVLELQNLDRSLTNTALVTVFVVVGTVFTSILGGYAFARIRFPGRNAVFLVYIGSIMVPFVILIVPLYQLMVAMGWVDHLASLVFPFIFNAYGTFLMRQFFVSLPRDLEEAAFIDGASRWTTLWRIFVPLSMPAIAALGTFMFLYSWNSFVWPFIIINAGNTDNHVLTLSLQILGGRAADSPNLVLAGVALSVAVPVVVYILLQRYFIENVATSGIK